MKQTLQVLYAYICVPECKKRHAVSRFEMTGRRLIALPYLTGEGPYSYGGRVVFERCETKKSCRRL